MSKLDRYDLSILAELQRDARISNQELAERIGLSPSPCSRRVKQLEDDGYITRQVALLDRKMLGLSLTAKDEKREEQRDLVRVVFHLLFSHGLCPDSRSDSDKVAIENVSSK